MRRLRRGSARRPCLPGRRLSGDPLGYVGADCGAPMPRGGNRVTADGGGPRCYRRLQNWEVPPAAVVSAWNSESSPNGIGVRLRDNDRCDGRCHAFERGIIESDDEMAQLGKSFRCMPVMDRLRSSIKRIHDECWTSNTPYHAGRVHKADARKEPRRSAGQNSGPNCRTGRWQAGFQMPLSGDRFRRLRIEGRPHSYRQEAKVREPRWRGLVRYRFR